MPEIWDLYDMHRKLTDKTIARSVDTKIPAGLFHMIVCVIVFNNVGEVLIQRRAADKIGWPGRWDITAVGSACAGETSQAAAQRELFEEVGINYDLTNAMPRFTTYGTTMFTDYYVIELEPDIGALQLQADEVQAVRWAGRGEILAMIDAGTFTPLKRGFIELVFDMRLSCGVLKSET